ncbi:MAG TPA: copper ion binding protein [Actinomycetota bacterium]|nr:copper ion binding protein [Actinomycetota bacterium]
MSEKVLAVPEVHCGHCVSSIEGAVSALDGVKQVSVDLERKDVTVDFDESTIALDHIVSAIEEQGYQVGGDGGPKLHSIEPRP